MSIITDIDFKINEALRKLDVLEAETRKSFEKQEKHVKKSSDQFVATMRRAFATIATLVTFGLVSRVVKGLFDMGTAAEETASKFATVFRSASKDVDAFVDNFIKKTQLTRAEGREAAATFGGLAAGLGASDDQAGQFSKTLLALAGDLSSFNDKPLQEAIQALQSGMVGEQESLKRFNVVLRQQQADEAALAITKKKNASALTEWERAQGRLLVIQQQAAQQIGDLDRTSDSLANRTRRVQGEFARLAEEISIRFLPLFEDVIDLFETDNGDFGAGIADGVKKYIVQPIRRFIMESRGLGRELSNIADIVGNSWEIMITRIQAKWRTFAAEATQAFASNGFVRLLARAIPGQPISQSMFDAVEAAAANVDTTDLWEKLNQLGEKNVELMEERKRIIEETKQAIEDMYAEADANDDLPDRIVNVPGPTSRTLGGGGDAKPFFVDGSYIAQINQQVAAIVGEMNNQIRAAKLTFFNEDEQKAQIDSISAYADVQLRQQLTLLRNYYNQTGNKAALQAVDDIVKHMSGGAKTTEKMKRDWQSIANSGRALLGLASVFGTISEDVKNLASSLIDVADGIGDLNRLDPNASITQKIAPFLTIGAGALSGIIGATGILSGGSRNQDNIREMQALREALKENARKISESVDRLVSQTTVGSGTSGEGARTIQDSISDFIDRFTGDSTRIQDLTDEARQDERLQDVLIGEADALRDGLDTAIDQLLQTIIDSGNEATKDYAQSLVDFLTTSRGLGVPIEDAIKDLLYGSSGIEKGIVELLGDIGDTIGSAAEGSVEGFLDTFNLLGQFLDEDATQALNRFVQSLLDSSVDISSEFREGLQNFLSGDLSQADLRAWLQTLAERLGAGGATSLLGSLADTEFQSILDVLEGLTQGVSSGSGSSSSASYGRVVTEIQQDVTNQLLREGLYWDERQTRALEKMAGISIGTDEGIRVSDIGRTFIDIGGVKVDYQGSPAQVSQLVGREVARMVEQAIIDAEGSFNG